MTLHVPEERYKEIEVEISNFMSPVGIDAKKTHIIILYMLEEIQQRLDRIEAELGMRSKKDA